MQYDIKLHINQTYEYAASGGRHSLRVMPNEVPMRQRLVSGVIDIEPYPDEIISRYDFFGNPVTDVAYRSPHSKITLEVKARVERLEQPRRFDVSPTLRGLMQDMCAMRDLGPESPHHYLGVSPRVNLFPVVSDYAKDQVNANMTIFQVVEAFGQAIHRDFKFDPEATHVDTPLIEAFERRHGVCQDYTHVMIAGLRGLGIPACYVSGFLRTIPPEGQKERLEGADAMHAWVCVWGGREMGWIEYDPTNAMFVDQDHISVAMGRDYSEAAPVRGILKTSGEQVTDQAVDVIPLNSF